MIRKKIRPWRLHGRDYVRGLVRERDNNQCQDCKRKWSGGKRFDVHHLNGLCGKKSRGYDRIADMDGLITLCHSCHLKGHVKWSGKFGVLANHVNEIKKLRERGESYGAIGKKFGVSSQAVYFRVNGR